MEISVYGCSYYLCKQNAFNPTSNPICPVLSQLVYDYVIIQSETMHINILKIRCLEKFSYFKIISICFKKA